MAERSTNRKFEFATAEAYLDALRENPRLAFLPVQMAADIRNVSRPAIVRMLELGQLGSVTIAGNRYVWAESLVSWRSLEQDDAGKVRRHLEQCAREHRYDTYDPVMSGVGLNWRKAPDRKKIGGLLEKVSQATWNTDRILLSVLVCRKATGLPSSGFFTLAQNLGLSWDDERAFAQDHMRRAWEHYGKLQAS